MSGYSRIETGNAALDRENWQKGIARLRERFGDKMKFSEQQIIDEVLQIIHPGLESVPEKTLKLNTRTPMELPTPEQYLKAIQDEDALRSEDDGEPER